MADKPVCEIENCSKPVQTKGLCWGHYRKLLRYGNPLWTRPKVVRPECSVEGCLDSSRGSVSGLCSKHYQRHWKHGDPEAGRTEDGAPMAFFRDVVLSYSGTDCLTWPYATSNGYGQIRINGKARLVHRLACIARHGPPPSPKMQAAHVCGCGHLGCCSPFHVEWKTAIGNAADRLIHGTSLRGEALHSSKLTEEDVYVIRSLEGTMTLKQIGDQFGVCASTICAIKNRRLWAWLD